jgi:phosphate transport system substrate-binding protein
MIIKTTLKSLSLIILAGALLQTGCGKSESGGNVGGSDAKKGDKTVIQNIGSDTMVNLAQAWSEEYSKVDPSVSVEVSGGGSGIGVAALLNKTADIANCSRRMEPEEIEKAKKVGEDPKEFMVGFDALSIYVHKNNPLNEISMEELGEIYKENGKITKWSELGVKVAEGQDDKIIRVSRQNNSGTYAYFREAVVGKKNDFRSGSLDMNGSKDVVELVSKTPGAIGYSGMGYVTPNVKVVKVSKKKGEPAVAPSIASTLDKTYPIARPMFMYTPGEPAPHIKRYIEWVMSEPGQKMVEATGYVPLPKK